MQYISELIEGRVYIDGYYRRDIGLGDTFIVDSKPEYRLKCIKFLLWQISFTIFIYFKTN